MFQRPQAFPYTQVEVHVRSDCDSIMVPVFCGLVFVHGTTAMNTHFYTSSDALARLCLPVEALDDILALNRP